MQGKPTSTVDELRLSIERAWYSRPENNAAAFRAGVQEGRKIMRAEVRKKLERI